MTEITINVDDKLYERAMAAFGALGKDLVGFLESHANDAIKIKLDDMAGEFDDPVPCKGPAEKKHDDSHPGAGSPPAHPKLEKWLDSGFKITLGALVKGLRGQMPSKASNFNENASAYLVEAFGKPGDDSMHWADAIKELIEQDEELLEGE